MGSANLRAVGDWDEPEPWRVRLRRWLRWRDSIPRSVFNTCADRLAETRYEVLVGQRAGARLKDQLAHWIDQAIRARNERDRAERAHTYAQACLASAMDRNVDLTTRILVLEGEAETFARQRENLTGIAEGLRDELRDLRAAVSIGAAQRKGRR